MWLLQLLYWTYSIHWLCLTLFTGRWWKRLLSMWRLPNSKPNNEYLGFGLSRVCLQVIPLTLLADCPHFLDKVWFVFLLIIEYTYERKFYNITFDTCHFRVWPSNWCFLISKLLSDPELSNFTYTFYVLYFSCCVISVLISRKLRAPFSMASYFSLFLQGPQFIFLLLQENWGQKFGASTYILLQQQQQQLK